MRLPKHSVLHLLILLAILTAATLWLAGNAYRFANGYFDRRGVALLVAGSTILFCGLLPLAIYTALSLRRRKTDKAAEPKAKTHGFQRHAFTKAMVTLCYFLAATFLIAGSAIRFATARFTILPFFAIPSILLLIGYIFILAAVLFLLAHDFAKLMRAAVAKDEDRRPKLRRSIWRIVSSLLWLIGAILFVTSGAIDLVPLAVAHLIALILAAVASFMFILGALARLASAF